MQAITSQLGFTPTKKTPLHIEARWSNKNKKPKAKLKINEAHMHSKRLPNLY